MRAFFSFGRRDSQASFARVFFGGVLVLVTTVVLTALAFALQQKWAQPTAVAQLLPAADTYLFFSLQTDRQSVDYAALLDSFATTPGSLLGALDLASLPLPDDEVLPELLGERLAVAFFGADFSPSRYAVFADVADEVAAEEFFAELELLDAVGETGLYQLAGSVLVFRLGGDLVFAADAEIARSVLADTPRLAGTAAYAQLQARVNPRSPGHGYVSAAAVRDATLTQLGGLRYVAGGAVTDLFSAGAFSLQPATDGVSLRFFLPLQDRFARLGGFVPQADLALDLANLLAGELRWVYAADDLAAEFSAAQPALGDARSTLLAGTAQGVLIQRFGISPAVLGSLAASRFAVGERTDGSLVLVSALDPTGYALLLADLKAGSGTDFAETETWMLPDGTTGNRLIGAAGRTQVWRVGDVDVTRLAYPSGAELLATQVGELVFLSTSEAGMRALLARLLDSGAPGISDVATAASFGAEDFFFMPVVSELPQLVPFSYLLAGREMDASGLGMHIFLGH